MLSFPDQLLTTRPLIDCTNNEELLMLSQYILIYPHFEEAIDFFFELGCSLSISHDQQVAWVLSNPNFVSYQDEYESLLNQTWIPTNGTNV